MGKPPGVPRERKHRRFTLVVGNTCAEITSNPVDAVIPCDPDINRDGNVNQDDVAYLVGVVAGGEDPGGIDPDFNRDGNVDQDDIATLITYVGGGGCP